MTVTADEVCAWAAGRESLVVEFKGEPRGRLNDTDLVEAVACMANASGGVLLIGVKDDGTMTGAQPRHRTYTNPKMRARPQMKGRARKVRPNNLLLASKAFIQNGLACYSAPGKARCTARTRPSDAFTRVRLNRFHRLISSVNTHG